MQTKSKKILQVGGYVLLVLVGLTLGYMMGKLGVQLSTNITKSALVVLAILFIPGIFMVIGFHEAGHALAGNLVNFNFKMYVIGPFMWEKKSSGWKFKWNKNVNIAGGMVLCLPRGTNNLPKRFSWYAAGGPLASLLLTVLGSLIFAIVKNRGIDDNTPLQVIAFFFLILSFFSFLIFLVTSIPMNAGGFSSDGARIYRLMRGGDTATFEILILQILTQSTDGLRPRFYDENALIKAKVLADKLNAPFGVYIHSFLHQRSFDLGDYDAAEIHLSNYIHQASSIPDGIRNIVWLDAAFFYAFAKQDQDKATHYWNLFKPAAMIAKAQIFATDAAIDYLYNKPAEAISKIEKSILHIPDMIDKGVGVALFNKLNNLRQMICAAES